MKEEVINNLTKDLDSQNADSTIMKQNELGRQQAAEKAHEDVVMQLQLTCTSLEEKCQQLTNELQICKDKVITILQ